MQHVRPQINLMIDLVTRKNYMPLKEPFERRKNVLKQKWK